ncbi:MAG TPA: B12-binding domain-containing radical SAM protein [Nannocystis exedens]|nr:B12-binding domain-containing radical SAM protein [Nannocystis exedens]
MPPLGLAYIAAATREAGHRVDVIDGTGEALGRHWSWPSTIGELVAEGLELSAIAERVDPLAAVIGISHMFLHQWPLLRVLCPLLRQRAPKARIILGGENATAHWAQILSECPTIDACVLGEGETTFVELLATIADRRPLSEVAGLAIRVGTRLRLTDPRPRQRQEKNTLDGLPLPAWDLLPVDAYLDHGCRSGVDRGRSMPVLTSRGCPFRCSFCSSPTMWGTRYRRRDPERVADEIADLVRRYRVTNIDLNDLTAMLTKQWILEFAQLIRDRNLGVSLQLPSGTRSEAIDAEAARALVAAGCRNFTYAPESGSRRTLRRIHKRVDLLALRRSMRASIDAGLITHASIIIGFPHERLRDLAATLGLVLRLAADGCHTVAIIVFAPYPGSQEYNELLSAGAIQFDDSYYFGSLLRSAGGLRSYHPRLNARALLGLQLGGLVAFFASQFVIRPRRAFDLLRRLSRGEQSSVLDQFLSTKLRQFWPNRHPRKTASEPWTDDHKQGQR